ncbi:hypothetical protein PO909_001723 [Leuciscus waleckii]
MPLYVSFIDLTKAFNLVSRSGLFRLLHKIGCPPQLLAVVTSFHDNMHSTICFNGATSESFPISSGVKQGCALAPTLFGIFFSILLQYDFKDCIEGVYIHTRADGKVFNIAHLRAKTKVTKVLIHEMLFTDDAALTAERYGLTICLKKTKVMAQEIDSPSTVAIDGYITYARNEKKLNSFHLRCLRHILRIQWQDKVPNTEVLEHACIRSMSAIPSKKRLRWLGHVRRMGSGRIPKDLLYSELAESSRLTGRPRLCYKDICKKDMKLSDINVGTWESRAEDRSTWQLGVRQGIQKAEETKNKNLAANRVRRKEKQLQPQQALSFTCRKCHRDCHSRVGLYSHSCRIRVKT